MKLFKGIFLVFLVSVVLVACGNNQEVTNSGGSNGENSNGIKVGYAINTLNNPFFVEVKESAEVEAKERGISLSVVNANDDLATQMNGIEDLIQQGVDVLIIDPVDSKGTASAVESANKAGIPVITTGRTIEGGEVVTHLGYDEIKNGEIAGEFLAEQIGEEGKVVELQGTLGTDTARLRSEGFQKAIGNYPNIEIVASQSADFDRAEAITVLENILQANPEINGVYASNDEMALGALQALQAANITDVVIVGNDGTEEALESVDNGELSGTMAISPSAYGQKAIEIAIAVVNGESQPDYVELPATFVTKENVQEWLGK